MSIVKARWVWETYLFFVLMIAIKHAYLFFTPGSEEHLFFYFLRAFDRHFNISYWINAAQIIVNILSCVPLGLWIYNRRFLRPRFWQAFFIIKIILDIFGQTFDRIEIVSFYHMDPFICFLLGLQYFLIYFPLYMILFQFAFRPPRPS